MTSKGARMMRKGILLIGSMAAIAFAVGAAWAATPTPTPSVPFPSKGAALYKANMVAAMEPCDPLTGVTLHIKGPAGGKQALAGCDPVASDALRFVKAQLTLKKSHGKLMLNADLGAANAGKKVAIGLTLNSSREKANFWEGNELEVTYLPLELTCPGAAPFTADTKGKIVQSIYLNVCAPLLSPLAVDPITGGGGGTEEKTLELNIEVLDAVLIDVATGKVFARAGIAR